MTHPSEHQNIPRASKSLLKEVRALQQAKFRKESGAFVAEGMKVVDELLSAQLSVLSVLGEYEAVLELSKKYPDAVFFHCSQADLEYCSSLRTPNRVIAAAKIPATDHSQEIPVSESVLILDGLSDPGNMGTLIRTAEWFGIQTVYCSADCVDCWSPKVVQSAMGSLFRGRMIYTDLLQLIRRMTEAGSHRILAAALDGDVTEQSPQSLFALVIGSESHGIRPPLLSLIPTKVTIPKAPDALTESLNAAVAAGILLSKLTKK